MAKSDLSTDQNRLACDQLAASQTTSRVISDANAALREQMDESLSQLKALRTTPQERIAAALERIATVMEREAVPTAAKVSYHYVDSGPDPFESWLNAATAPRPSD